MERYLPPEIRKIVQDRIIEQGKDIDYGEPLNRFDWTETEEYGEGVEFWTKISNGDFRDFFEKYHKEPFSESRFFWQDGKQVKLARLVAPIHCDQVDNITARQKLEHYKYFYEIRNYFLSELGYEEWWKNIPHWKRELLDDVMRAYDDMLCFLKEEVSR